MTIRRQDIIDAVKTRLALITVAGGYQTNIGAHVISGRGRTIDGGYIPIDDTELPCVIPRYPITEAQRINLDGAVDWRMTVEIEIRCEEGSTTEAFLVKAIHDVYKAIGTDEKWSTKALRTERVNDEMVIGQAEKIVGMAVVKVVILYSTTGWTES